MTKHPHLLFGRFRFSLDPAHPPLVMGILNLTPDSFSDGGKFPTLDSAISHAEQMMAEGVDIIDIGGESSRPGALPLSDEEELERVMPVLYALRDCGKPLSVDTCKPLVMREAIAAGADMINDINGFRAEGALAAVSDSEVALCIMHMLGEPRSMQHHPQYEDVVTALTQYFKDRVAECSLAGIAQRRLCIDPGFGFGKTLPHNLALLQNLRHFQQALGLPVLAGLSRKTMIGALTGKPVEGRLAGSLAAALVAAEQGARIIRVHDVAETVDALKVWQAARQLHTSGE